MIKFIKKVYPAILIYLIDVLLTALTGSLIVLIFREQEWNYTLWRPFIFAIATVVSVSLILFTLIYKRKLSIDVSRLYWNRTALVVMVATLALLLRHFLFNIENTLHIDFSIPDILNKLFPILIIAPVFEELFYRNIIQKVLSLNFNIHFSVMMASGFFALEHMFSHSFTSIFFLYHFIGGATYGYAYHYSKNILVSIGLHFLFNLSAILFL